MAYPLVSGLQRLGLKATELAHAQVSTIRTMLLRLGSAAQKAQSSGVARRPFCFLHSTVIRMVA
jgi:hypothetical protein